MVLDEADVLSSGSGPSVQMVDEDDEEAIMDSPENVERFASVLGETKVNVGASIFNFLKI